MEKPPENKPKRWRLTLDDGFQYDPVALFLPVSCARPEAWQSLRANARGFWKGLTIPFRASRRSLQGTLAWLLFMPLYVLAILWALILWPLGQSPKAWQIWQARDQQRLPAYREAVRQLQQELADVEDPDEYQRRFKEGLERIKPY